MIKDLSFFDKKYLLQLKKSIINDANTKKELLEAFLQDDNNEIKLEVVKSKYCTKDILLKSIYLDDANVYEQSLNRLLGSEFILTKEEISLIEKRQKEIMDKTNSETLPTEESKDDNNLSWWQKIINYFK